MDNNDAIHVELTDGIIRCFYKVYNKLRYGFLERVYQNALRYELEKSGYAVEVQKKIEVYYEDHLVGEYYADLVVNDFVIIELKAAESLCDEHAVQLLNYLRATKVEVGLLLNFGKQPQVSRKQFRNVTK